MPLNSKVSSEQATTDANAILEPAADLEMNLRPENGARQNLQFFCSLFLKECKARQKPNSPRTRSSTMKLLESIKLSAEYKTYIQTKDSSSL